jgi:hypothetical protein
MSTGQGQGGGKKPPQTDDRTLLDPLSNDELKALREARQRMQAKKGSAVAHQIVIGPDSGEDIGDAPTRAMPALPTFESNATPGEDRSPTGSGSGLKGRPQEPMSTAPTVSPAVIRVPRPRAHAGSRPRSRRGAHWVRRKHSALDAAAQVADRSGCGGRQRRHRRSDPQSLAQRGRRQSPEDRRDGRHRGHHRGRRDLRGHRLGRKGCGRGSHQPAPGPAEGRRRSQE